MMCSASGSKVTCSFFAIKARWWLMSSVLMRLKLNTWHRDRMVGMILCFSVVARMNLACFGGSSRVLRKALKAELLSMCTSSITYTLYAPSCGANRTWSTRWRISSTELFDAASSSYTLSEAPLLNETQDSHLSQASPAAEMLMQLMVLAKIRAQV